LIAIASLDDQLHTARSQALSACNSVENAGSALASMPHYLSGGVNELTAQGMEKAVHGLSKMLLLTIQGVEEIVVFGIDMVISNYVCLITFAIGGSLHVAIEVAEDVGNSLNSTIKDVGKDLARAASTLQSAINGIASAADKIGDFFTGGRSAPPTVDFSTEIGRLNNLQLPVGYDANLQKLDASIPDFKDVMNFTNNAVRFPFKDIRKLVNQSLPTFKMDRSLFPVPAKQELTFCSENNGINEFFDKLVHIEQIARRAFIAVLLIAAILVCVPIVYREIKRWKKMQASLQTVDTDAVDNTDAAYIISRPYTSAVGLALAKKAKTVRAKAIIRKSVAYSTTVPALFILSLGFAGLLACLCQYILLKSIEREVPGLSQQVGAFAEKVLQSLNNASIEWANGTNAVISRTNLKINQDVFGWVNTSTTALNNTLNVFVDGVVDVLNVTFGGTPLYTPVLDVLNCLILYKIEGIEKALTWVHDNAYIEFPELPLDTFSLGAAQQLNASGSNSLLASAPVAAASDEISNAILHVTHVIGKGIRQEAIISSCILLVWVIVVFVGSLQAYYTTSPSRTGRAETVTNLDSTDRHGVFFGIDSDCEERHQSSPILREEQHMNEKIGVVESGNIQYARDENADLRKSSHANLDVTTPIHVRFAR